MNKGIKIGLVLLLLAGMGGSLFWFFTQKKQEEPSIEKKETPKPIIEEKKLKIVDPKSKSRPIAVMINNNEMAWDHHAGIGDAYLVYEIITEGGITRLMAIFKDQKTERIGSVRSSRHYFLDYALENDAVYTHFGWSERAKSDIASLNIANVNGLYDNAFWRDTSLDVAWEHTAFTSIEKIKADAKRKNYRESSEKDLLLNYSIDPVDISGKEKALEANFVKIPYSYHYTVSYQYDAINKVYLRSMNTYPHTDDITKKQYTAKNIIVASVSNYSFDSYGRQDLNNIGKGNGYYITNGFAVPITWKKESRSAQTIYQYLDGTEITVNDGNTFIQIQPNSFKTTFQAVG